jgi:hypothetical protein
MAVAASFALAGIGLWLVYSATDEGRPSATQPSHGLIGVCPLRAGRPLVTIDRIYSRDKRSYHHFYNLYDASTGERGLRTHLTSVGMQPVYCVGYEDDLVWLVDQEHGVHSRHLESGALVQREADVAALAPSPVHELWFDTNGGHVRIATKDGRQYHLLAAEQRLVALPSNHDARRATGINLIQPGSQWGELDETRRLRPEGQDRRRFFVGDAPLGTRDWLNPNLLYHPVTRHALWPNPDSVLIVEPVELKSRIRRITRVGLGGVEHWSYTPDVAGVHDAPYVAGAADGLLLYITATAELIGLDADTGSVRYRVHL